MSMVDSILASQVFWGVVTLVLAAWGVAWMVKGPPSMTAATWLLIAAGATASIGVYRSGPILRLPWVPRSFLMGIVVCSIGLGLYYVNQSLNRKPEAEKVDEKSSSPTVSSKSLHDYFSADNFGLIAATDPNHAVQFKTELVQVEAKLYADFNGKSAFLGFYIPNTKRTRDVCLALMDDCDSVLDTFHKTMPAQVKIPGSKGTELKDLKFTGRIFFYYEGALFQSDQDLIELKAAQKGLFLQFRGPDYAMLQNNGLIIPSQSALVPPPQKTSITSERSGGKMTANKRITDKGMTLIDEEFGVPIALTDIDRLMGGIVTDADGIALKDAIIAIQDRKTGARYQVDSDADGRFRKTLPFGSYEFTVQHPGYRTETRRCDLSKDKGCWVSFDGLQKIPTKPNSN